MFDINSIFGLMVAGFVSGIGSAFANYLVLEHFLKRVEQESKGK